MANPIIEVKNLKKYYQVHQKEPGLTGSLKSLFNRKYYDVKAVDDTSFEIKEGELIGFIGPNGAGKTTTLKCLSGLLYPSSGKVSVLGFTPYERKSKFLKQIALVMGQKNQLWWDLPAMDSFLLNKEIYEISNDQFKKTLDELVELLEIKDIINVQVRKLSLGQRMKCELIAALIHSPKVLFLDEPTIGLDVVMQQKLREFIKVYNNKFNSTILLTSHYMQDVKELCERVLIIDHGKILYDGKLDNIVKKYSKEKTLTLTLKKQIEKAQFEKYGKVEHYDFPQVILNIPSKDSNKLLGKILEEFPIEDITIEDPSIEEIIRTIFSSKKHEF
jgi:ABC-2 type transport system ATP-binding protein